MIYSVFLGITTPKSQSPKRNSHQQKSMRKKVMLRNRMFHFPANDQSACYKCDICLQLTKNGSEYINSHVIARGLGEYLYDAAYVEGKNVPGSPSYVDNGLLLCRQCDKYFEDHTVTICEDGTINVALDILHLPLYKKLNNKKVAWATEIDRNRLWPTSSCLKLRNGLPKVTSRHRLRELGFDDDADSVDSEYEPETEVCLELVSEYNCFQLNALFFLFFFLFLRLNSSRV